MKRGEDWFGSSYYRLLYEYRSEEEAQLFTGYVIKETALQVPARIWDMACGRGRHVRAWSSKGFEVWATDVSLNNIIEAKQLSTGGREHYAVHDYRKLFFINFFDCVLNVFTSMGYSSRPGELSEVFHAAFRSLRKGGWFILDYLNASYVLDHWVPHEKIRKANCEFEIERCREYHPDAVRKKIRVHDGTKELYFEEYVRLFSKEDFLREAEHVGFKTKGIKGNYMLEEFRAKESPRLILLLRKEVS